MRRTISISLFASAVLMSFAGVASAQAQFGTCPATLPQCDSDTDDCCYRTFDPISTDRAVIIPMDRCHQVVATSGKDQPPPSSAPAWCLEPGGASADEGMFQTYGLVYRLMQNGIPVYWVINPTKEPTEVRDNDNYSSQVYTDRDIDFWVVEQSENPPTTSSPTLDPCAGTDCTAPVVTRLNPNDLTSLDPYNHDAFPVRGGAFVIAPEDRARFNDFWLKQGEFSSFAGQSKYDFSEVDVYEVAPTAEIVYQEYGERTWNGSTWIAPSPPYNVVRAAPVAVRIDYEPPRLARQAPAGVSEVWLETAKLDDPAARPGCLTGEFVPEDAVYCDMTESEIRSGYLVDGEFIWAWIDNWGDNSPCGDVGETTQVDKVLEFMQAVPGVRPGGHVMFMEAVIEVFEGCPNREPAGRKGLGLASDNSAPVDKNNASMIFRYPSNLFMQFGDLPATFASGSPGSWVYYGGSTESGLPANGYEPSHLPSNGGTLVRLITQDNDANGLCEGHRSEPECDTYGLGSSHDTQDAAHYLRYEDDPRNGIAFYMGGNNVNSHAAHLRMILNALIALPVATVPQEPSDPIEVSRAAPIIATVDGVEGHYQGTYEVHQPPEPLTAYESSDDDDTFEFPYTLGHMRAVDTSLLSETELEFTDVTPIFDAADGIPTPSASGCSNWFSASCRTVFTNVASGQDPEPVYMHTGNVSQLKPLMGSSLTDAEAETLISRVLAGRKDGSTWEPALGGVDRSTVAVIESSPLTGNVRPTMVYFGALDGMIHAVCAEVLGPCNYKGQELWAFVPRTQLPNLRFNTQRIDGSTKIADVFDDFDDDGTNEWRTIMTFQTGSGEAGFTDRAPAAFAIDITDPADPDILWEKNPPAPAARGDVEQGVGLGLAMGPVRVGGETINMTFIQTNNGGLGGPGTKVIAVDTVTGEVVWSFDHLYPKPSTREDDGTDLIRAQDETIPPVPSTGIPGGVAAFDMDEAGTITHVAVSTLYGDLWLFDATDGTNEHGSDPVFRFSEDFHPIGAPPTIYFDRSTGRLHGIVVSGGYADPIGSSWAPASVEQYAVSVALDAPTGVVPMLETGGDFSGNRAFVINLGAGNRAAAQAIVSGNELFITTDSDDINSTTYGLGGSSGKVGQYSLSGGTHTADYTVGGGAGSVDVRGGNVFAGSGKSAKKITPSTFDEEGDTAELEFDSKEGRQLWLRLN